MIKRRVLHGWIALLAVLFAALAPTVSHALAANAGYDTIEMCTANGYKTVKIAQGGAAPATAKAGMDHCAFCATHGGTHALPGVSAFVIPLVAGRDDYPPLFYSAPRPPHAWSPAHPRGPPSAA